MVASIDGRIDCSMVDKISGDEYYDTLAKLECPASLEGRVTMEHYNALTGYNPVGEGKPVGRESVWVAEESDAYTLCVDTMGRLRWPSATVNGQPLVCVVSEQVSEDYLAGLKAQGISWIAVGKEEIDLHRAMEILYQQFHVQRLAVLGGGHINGGFLEAGLIDEVSLLLAPGIDGRKGMTALFDGIDNRMRGPVRLNLNSVDNLGEGILWLRYSVERS